MLNEEALWRVQLPPGLTWVSSQAYLMMKSHSRSFGLDFVRAFAIALVLVAHFAKTLEFFGFWGVELFFGLSGFLIGQILWRNYSRAESWTVPGMVNFWARRWWRTLPNYYLFFVISLAFQYFYFHQIPSQYAFLSSLVFAQNLLVRNREFYGVSWSLCIEEWFYLLFPILLFGVSKIKLKPKVCFALTLAIFIAAVTITRELIVAHGQADSVRTITLARLDAIACGVLIAFVTSIIQVRTPWKVAGFFLGIVLLLSPIITAYFTGIEYSDLRQNHYLLLAVPLGASLILPLVSMVPSPAGAFSFIGTIVESMSLWSYSIYLSHIPVLFVVYALMNGIRDSTAGNLLSKFVGLIITIVVSALVFKYFELPITKKRPPELKEEKRAPKGEFQAEPETTPAYSSG